MTVIKMIRIKTNLFLANSKKYLQTVCTDIVGVNLGKLTLSI